MTEIPETENRRVGETETGSPTRRFTGSPFQEITKCRISSSTHLVPMLSLGNQSLTGVFPKSIDAPLSQGPLDLVWCPDSGLLQMKQSYPPAEMYGANYGYRSGLNGSMVRHLQQKVAGLERLGRVSAYDLVLDIGSNDATLLKAYSDARLIGIDPTGDKFKDYYFPDNIRLVTDFFSAAVFREASTQPAKIITAIAMFYDLESPLDFLRDIEEILADDGLFHFEQSYMPSMLRTNSYDSICHEHLEFYSFAIVKRMLEASGLRVVDVQMNDINGGSFAVTACKTLSGSYHSNAPVIDWLLHQEEGMGLDTPRPYREFETRVFQHRRDLRALVNALVADGKTIAGYGASTKGNVLLQFCGFTTREIPFIAEVNEDKVGAFTPGTHIPIVSEAFARGRAPDYFLVLPWHFKYGIMEREKTYMANGGKLLFPLPEIVIV